MNPGAITGTNTFTGTSVASNQVVCIGTGSGNLRPQYDAGVQASATAGTNVWQDTWTNSRHPLFIAASFFYIPAVVNQGNMLAVMDP